MFLGFSKKTHVKKRTEKPAKKWDFQKTRKKRTEKPAKKPEKNLHENVRKNP